MSPQARCSDSIPNEITYSGLVIRSHCVRDAESKEKASHPSGWQVEKLTAQDWIKELELGHTIQPSYFNPATDKDGKVIIPLRYTHKGNFWCETYLVCLDADNIQGVEFYDEDIPKQNIKAGDDKHPDGVPYWTELKHLSTLYPTLKDEVYAVVQSVSSMSKSKPPLHRRYRFILRFDKPITCALHFQQILSTFAERYPIIDPTERAPSQPVFGNARPETCKAHIVGNVLSLDDYPYTAPVETPASSPVGRNGSGNGKSKTNATQRKYQNNLAGMIADAKLVKGVESADGTIKVGCPFDSTHTGAWVGLDSDGYPYFKCHHNSCSGNGFNEMVKSAGVEVVSERKPNPVREMKDASHFFVGTDFNVLAMSEHIQSTFRVWSQDSGIYIYDAPSGCYVPGEMDIDQAVRDTLGSLRKKRYVEEVLADLASTCRRDVPDTSDLIGFKNGVLRLNVGDGSGLGDFSPHSPNNYLMSTFPVDFNLSAPETEGSKDFGDWLLDVLGGDSGLWCLLYEVVGSIYHRASVDMQQGILLIGEGGTGKSMFLSQVERMTGRNNICARDWGDYGRDQFAWSGVYGKSLVLGADLDVGRSLSGAIKPAITGNTLSNNAKHKTAFDFNPYATWLGSINRFPRTKDKTWGFFRRWIAVPFNKRFEIDSQFEKSKRALWSEPETMSRIVYDALRLYVVAYQNGNYTVPDSAAALSRDMHRASNSVITWLDDCTTPDESEVIDRQQAFASYAAFCQALGVDAESNRSFYDTLRSQGYSVDKYQKIDGKSTRVVQGFQIADTEATQEATHLFP